MQDQKRNRGAERIATGDDVRPRKGHRRFALRAVIGGCAFALALSGVAAAQSYPPDGPDIPSITLNEGPQGAAGLPPLNVPPPKGWDQQSIWNMQAIGFNDNQGRASSDDGWIENQNGQYILYVTNNGSDTPTHHFNPLTNQIEKDGTSLIDVTDPTQPNFLYHIPSTAGSSTHLAVCGGSTLPHGQAGHFYLLRHDGSTDWEIWDTTNPSLANPPTRVGSPFLINGKATHHAWWECDTGIAYMVFQSKTDGWVTDQHVYIYDLSDPAHPQFIRQWGLPGQQPNSTATQSCYNAPSDNCYEGVVNPPSGTHDIYSAGQVKNRVYFAYSASDSGMVQIVDRQRLLTGCDTSSNPSASTDCANHPTQADLLYPQISYLTLNPLDGGHTFIPIFGVPIPQEQSNFLTGPVRMDLAIELSEQTANDCAPQKWKNPSIVDISNDLAPWPISTATVGQFPGDFCLKGARFGTHEMSRRIFAPYYGRLLIVSFFNAGLQVFDIRDPYSPRRVAYFIQAPNKATKENCGTYRGNPHYCRKATFSDLGEVDDRGYIYNFDRAGSGMTILRLTGAAAQVAGSK